MKSKISRRIPAIALMVLMSMFIGIGAQAATNPEIRAVVNKTISVVYHGQKQTLLDGNGNVVYPLSVNGTTYVPLRAVSQIFGEPIRWDGDTQSAIIGSVTGDPMSALKGVTGGTHYSWLITEKGDLSIGGNNFKNGVGYNMWNGDWSAIDSTNVIWFDTQGRSKLSFTAYSDVKCKIVVFSKSKTEKNDKGKQYYESIIEAGTFNPKELDISGCEQIGFAAERLSLMDPDNDIAEFFDPILK